jgi:hypothetical protein
MRRLSAQGVQAQIGVKSPLEYLLPGSYLAALAAVIVAKAFSRA